MREMKIEPATIVDLADMASHAGYSRAMWGMMRELLPSGETWALRAGGTLIGVAGILPIGPGQGEAWFHFRPEAAPVMLQVVRAIRLTISASPYRAIVTLCTSAAGCRIARAAGFAFVQGSDFGEVWAYGRFPGLIDRWGAAAPAASHGGAAANDAGADGGATGRD